MDHKIKDCPVCRAHWEEYEKMMQGKPFALSWVTKSKCPLCGAPWSDEDRPQDEPPEPEQVSLVDWERNDG